MIRVSVFTVCAVLFYLLNIFSNAHFMGEYYAKGLVFLSSEGTKPISMPGLRYIVISMNILLAGRLYLHAWILDENEEYQRAVKSISRCRKFAEWFLRLLWVMGISWLPSAYSIFPFTISNSFKLHIHCYLFSILFFLLMWDGLMYSTIKSYTSQKIKDLKILWLGLDAIMLISITLSCFFLYYKPSTELSNWSIVIIPLVYIIICTIAGVQVYLWSGGIIKSLKI